MEIKEVLKDVLKEIERIKTDAHKDYYKNDMNKWLAVIGEEYGEMLHAANDKHNKEYYLESVQTIAAILLSLTQKGFKL